MYDTRHKKTPPQLWRRFLFCDYSMVIFLFSGTSSGLLGRFRVRTPSVYEALMAEVSMPETSKLLLKEP